MFMFWLLIGIASFVIFFLAYNLYDLWAFEDDFEATTKSTTVHAVIIVISALLWPFAWLFIAVALLTNTWDSFAAWYRKRIADQMINRI